MTIEQRLEVVAAAGTAFDVLFALVAATHAGPDELPADVRGALDDIGDAVGESWFNLLGVPLDAGPPYDAGRLIGALEALDGIELRRHLLGRYAWSWCTLAGTDRIDAAAAGDRAAITALLEHPRYYAGHSAESLSTLLPLDAEETKRRILAAVRSGQALLRETAAAELAAAEEAAATALAEAPALAAIERVTGGYRYLPELEAERVVLVPHLQARPALVFTQHRSSRVIAYRVSSERGSEERLLALGRALADPKRVEVLTLVGRGIGRSADLVTATGLTRSTIHHHLALLRDADLVGLEGNARAYTYVPRVAAAAEAATLLEDALGEEQ